MSKRKMWESFGFGKKNIVQSTDVQRKGSEKDRLGSRCLKLLGRITLCLSLHSHMAVKVYEKTIESIDFSLENRMV